MLKFCFRTCWNYPSKVIQRWKSSRNPYFYLPCMNFLTLTINPLIVHGLNFNCSFQKGRMSLEMHYCVVSKAYLVTFLQPLNFTATHFNERKVRIWQLSFILNQLSKTLGFLLRPREVLYRSYRQLFTEPNYLLHFTFSTFPTVRFKGECCRAK